MTQVFVHGRMGRQLDWVPPGGDVVAPDRSIDSAVALRHWSLPAPWTIAPASAGLTNTTLFVETPTGTYVLRLYERADPAGVRFEHGLLAELAAAHLPFTLPAPVRTRAGETFAQVVVGSATVLASLTPLLPGTHPDPDHVQHARRLGEALGHLGQALADVAPPPGRAQYPRLGDLRGFHATVDDPAEAIGLIPTLAHADRKRVLAMTAHVEAVAPSLYATLPRRLTHRDYWPPNILLTGDAVSAVLDFEFAGEDLRALDLAIAIAFWPLWGAGDVRSAACEAFIRGYAAVEPLTQAEAEAIPTLIRLQFATWLMHCAGRLRDGLTKTVRLQAFVVREALAYLEWSDANEPVFTQNLVRWSAGGDEPG
jgi:homoserine kinase type II